MKKILLFLLLIFVTGCNSTIENSFIVPYKYKDILSITNDHYVGEISEYTIYGKYFNLKGIINYKEDFQNIKLVLKSKNKELEYDLIYEKMDEIIKFKTNKVINEGINLEKIAFDNYVVFLKFINNDQVNYYNLMNKRDYPELDYYTITKNYKNNYINIVFSKYQEKDFLKMEMKKSSNKNICDLVIDPGHGGDDPGALNGNYQEKDLNLIYAKLIKEELDNLGLKVKLTRDSDISPGYYGMGTRTGIPYECHNKLMLSIHLNSSKTYMKDGGVEIYTANYVDYSFAKVLADNILNYADTKYSSNTSFKVMDGVYMRTYSLNDLHALQKDAQKNNWIPYENSSINTTYYYFLRETGGFMSGAINDGRNPQYPKNPYYNSNHGSESYLVELGYLSSSNNLLKLLNNKEGYVKGVVESIKYYINN